MFVISLVFIFVVLSLGFLSIYRLVTDDVNWHIPLLFASLIVISYALFLLSSKSEQKKEEIKEHIVEVSHSYSIYIDGVEVDVDNIDIDNYELNQIKVDDENEKIYITLNK